jgi:hypothetical protein
MTPVPRLAALAVLTMLALAARAPAQAAKEWQFEFHHDFRGRPLPVELTPFNAEDGRFFRQEPEGLRIVIPDTWEHAWGGIGFRTSFGLVGDFEATLAFELLHADTPPQGYGVGLCLYAAKAGGGGATRCRQRRPGDPPQRLWDHSELGTQKGGAPWYEDTLDCADKSGRLCHKRVGSTLHYLWAPGLEAGPYTELARVDYGDGPVDRIRLAGLTGRQRCNLDVRLLEFHVRSRASDLATQAAASPTRRVWTLWAVTAIFLGLGLAAWLAVRRGRRQRQPG